MPLFGKPDVRRVDDDIKLGDERNIRAYIIAAEMVDIDYREGPESHIPYPAKTVQYTRFCSKELIDPVDDKDKREKKRAIDILNELRRRDMNGDKKAKKYLKDYVGSVEHNGQRVADKVTDARNRLEGLEKERQTYFGIGKRVADVLGFRLPSAAGGYALLEGPFGDAEFDIGGVRFTGKDIGWLGFASFFGIASIASYSWKRRKTRKILKKLKNDLDKAYRQSISDTLEDLRRHYPETLVPVEPETKLGRRRENALMSKYIKHNGD